MISQRNLLTVLLLAVSMKPIIIPALKWLIFPPMDHALGTLPMMTQEELTSKYNNKTALIIGGTRGIGYGTAVALVKAGAHVVMVGRNPKQGLQAKRALLEYAPNLHHQRQDILYFFGDIGTVATTDRLMEKLKKVVKERGQKFDFLIVTAGIWPDWNEPQNSDGLEKAFAIDVLGRYLIYSQFRWLLKKETGRILNVLASGWPMPFHLDRDICRGEALPQSLAMAIINFNTAHELMLHALDVYDRLADKVVRVSTHPGVVSTQLTRGQPAWYQVVQHLADKLIAISVEEAGLQQASILASDRLQRGTWNYVDDAMTGRKIGWPLQRQINRHMDWLYRLLWDLREDLS